MTRPDALAPAPRIVPVGAATTATDEPASLRTCLRETPPRLPAWFGYDAAGSALFEQITTLPTYYLTRVERALLSRHRQRIAALLDCDRLAELGSGSARKTRLLLEACQRRRPTAYLPIDVSREMLASSHAALRSRLPGLEVTGLWGHYEDGLAWLRDHRGGPLVLGMLGANLGNTTPGERTALLADIARTLSPGDGFLVSADLRKPRDVLERCYNDPRGHTAFARFRLNYLTRLNQQYGADVALDRFVPRAHYDPATGVVAGDLEATEAHTVTLPGLGLTLRLARGDSINVGFSAKFDVQRFIAEVTGHGFGAQRHWVDPVWHYGIFLFRRVAAGEQPSGDA